MKILPMRTMIALFFGLLLSLPQLTIAAAVEEEPTALAMTGDLLIARPVLAGITVISTAVFIVALPFSLLGGNTAETAETLVSGPFEATFVRCLGCTQSGRKHEVRENADSRVSE
ncbi:hypothetical protein [Sinobacterium caligoides]|nr:hypothetical protein [Sinobacterium caligoides]